MEQTHIHPDRGHPALRLLLVDDEADLVGALSEILEQQGHVVIAALEGETAVDIASLFPPDVVITDFRLPGMDGVTVIRRIRESRPGIPAILVSGHLSPLTLRRAESEAIDLILEKPISIPELLHGLDAVAAA